MRTVLVASVAATLGLFGLAAAASAVPPPSENITLCHATAAVNLPYVVITVDVAGAGGQQQLFGPQGHASHTGPIFDAAVNQNGDNWGDIIPPFPDPDGAGPFQGFAGLNWSAEGQAIQANGCVPPGETTTTPPTSPPTTTTTTTTSPPVTTTSTSPPPPPPTTTTAPPPPPSTTPPPPPRGVPNQPPSTPTGTAFTGIDDVLPLGALALGLLGSGTGLYIAGRRRRR